MIATKSAYACICAATLVAGLFKTEPIDSFEVSIVDHTEHYVEMHVSVPAKKGCIPIYDVTTGYNLVAMEGRVGIQWRLARTEARPDGHWVFTPFHSDLGLYSMNDVAAVYPAMTYDCEGEPIRVPLGQVDLRYVTINSLTVPPF